MALDHDLEVIPVINKIDLPSAEPERVINEIEDVIGLEAQDAPQISAKTGLNVEQVLEQVVSRDTGTAGESGCTTEGVLFSTPFMIPIREPSCSAVW